MRKFIMAIALAAVALSTPACQTIRTATDAVALANQNVGDFTIADEKGWYYGEALYNVPASAYLSANSRFKDEPRWLAIKAQVKPLLQELNRYRQALYQAYKTGNSATFHEKLVQMKALSDQIRNLVPSS